MSEEKNTDRLKRIRECLAEVEEASIRGTRRDLSPGDWYLDAGAWHEIGTVELHRSGLATVKHALTAECRTEGSFNTIRVVKAGT